MPSTMPLTTTPITADLVRGALELEQTEPACSPTGCPPGPGPGARPAAADGREPALRRTPGLPYGGHHHRARHPARPSACTSAPRPAPTGSTTCVVDGQLVDQGTVPQGRAIVIDMTKGSFEQRDGEPGTLRFEGLPADPKDVEIWLPHGETTGSSRCAPTPRSSRCPTAGGRCGCTTAARSAPAPRPAARPPPGPPAPPRWAAWSWSTWASAAARCSTRSSPGPCATPRPT